MSPLDRARALVALLDQYTPGVGLVLDDELLGLIAAAIAEAQEEARAEAFVGDAIGIAERKARAQAFEDAARLIVPAPYLLNRLPDAVRVELESAAKTLRSGAGVVRSGRAWPTKVGG